MTELPNEMESRWYTRCSIALLIVVFMATVASWKLYPLFIDTYYHMGVIQGFSQAGGITTRAFWEMAPGGRVHIYPPSLHVIGYFLTFLGMSPRTCITLISAGCYFACFVTTWIWLRQIIGARSALLALTLLAGPSAFSWTQATFNAVAGVMVLAPLALLALEKERFLACGVLNFIAITMHPMGLFLPPALVITATLRRKKLLAGYLAASVPVLLYGPWLAHIWANRAFLPENRTGSEITLGGVGGGANLGLFLAPLAVVAVPWLCVRRGPALALVGALLGFVVVLPMGFGSRFLAFNIHWPLACLAGFALGETLTWCEKHARLRLAAQLAVMSIAVTSLIAYGSWNMPMGMGGPGGGPGGPGTPGGPAGGQSGRPGAAQDSRPRDQSGSGDRRGNRPRTSIREQITFAMSNVRFSVQAAALPKLFEAYSGGSMGGPGMGGPGMGGPGMGGPGMGGPGMGGPGMGGPGMGGPGMGGPGMGGPGMGGPGMGGPGMGGPGMGGPGMGGPGMGGPGMGGPGMGAPPDARNRENGGTDQRAEGANARDQRGRFGFGRGNLRGGMRPGMGGPGMGGPGMGGPGADMLRREGADEFFREIRDKVALGDVIYIDEAVSASMLVGVTGRWTSGGILRDVRSDNGRVRAEDCDFAVALGGRMGMGGVPEKFEKVFENTYGTLYRNSVKPKHSREPLKAAVSLPLLVVMAVVFAALLIIDLVPARFPKLKPAAGLLGTLLAGACLMPLTSAAIGELRHPPAAPARGNDGPPFGFGGPGGGPPGGGFPDFGPGRMLAEAWMREADADKSGKISLKEFESLAERWHKEWDADGNKTLEIEEVLLGLPLPPGAPQGGPPGMGGPMPPFGGGGGFDPAADFARAFFAPCDKNGDEHLDRGEMVEQFRRWFREWDEAKSGQLDLQTLGRGLDRIMVPADTRQP